MLCLHQINFQQPAVQIVLDALNDRLGSTEPAAAVSEQIRLNERMWRDVEPGKGELLPSGDIARWRCR